MPYDQIPAKFQVAFSFAGEERELVRDIATRVEESLGDKAVFYDEWFEAYLVGPRADEKLRDIYLRRATLVVQCFSKKYVEKSWTISENNAIRELRMEIDASANKADQQRLLPLKVSAERPDDLPRTMIYFDAHEKSVRRTAQLIISRLATIDSAIKVPAPAKPPPARTVYLAKCTEETEKFHANLMDFLDDNDWNVLPPADDDQHGVRTSEPSVLAYLKRSVAFVQLLPAASEAGSNYDRFQYELAQSVPDLARLRWCSVQKGDSLQAQAVLADRVISGNFEDFKTYIKGELEIAWQRRQIAAEGAIGTSQPKRVHVAIRSMEPEQLWTKIFEWFYDEQDIAPYLLARNETFESKYHAKPCQGFILLCDGSVLKDGPLSLRDDLDGCLNIQMAEKDASKRPPVGVIYYPPPDPAWALLLSCLPNKCHPIVEGKREDFKKFLKDLRAMPVPA